MVFCIVFDYVGYTNTFTSDVYRYADQITYRARFPDQRTSHTNILTLMHIVYIVFDHPQLFPYYRTYALQDACPVDWLVWAFPSISWPSRCVKHMFATRHVSRTRTHHTQKPKQITVHDAAAAAVVLRFDARAARIANERNERESDSIS